MHFKSSLYIKTKIDHGHSLLSSTEDRLISHRSWKRFRITCEAVNDRWRVKIGDTCCEKNLLIGWWTWWWSGEEMSWRAKSSSKKPSWKNRVKVTSFARTSWEIKIYMEISSPESEPSERENDDDPGKSLSEVAILTKVWWLGDNMSLQLNVLQLLVLIDGSSTNLSLYSLLGLDISSKSSVLSSKLHVEVNFFFRKRLNELRGVPFEDKF